MPTLTKRRRNLPEINLHKPHPPVLCRNHHCQVVSYVEGVVVFSSIFSSSYTSLSLPYLCSMYLKYLPAWRTYILWPMMLFSLTSTSSMSTFSVSLPLHSVPSASMPRSFVSLSLPTTSQAPGCTTECSLKFKHQDA